MAASAGVAQLVEHQLPKLRVAGPIPVARSMDYPVSVYIHVRRTGSAVAEPVRLLWPDCPEKGRIISPPRSAVQIFFRRLCALLQNPAVSMAICTSNLRAAEFCAPADIVTGQAFSRTEARQYRPTRRRDEFLYHSFSRQSGHPRHGRNAFDFPFGTDPSENIDGLSRRRFDHAANGAEFAAHAAGVAVVVFGSPHGANKKPSHAAVFLFHNPFKLRGNDAFASGLHLC